MKLNVKQAAELLNLKPETIERWVAQGTMPARRRGRSPQFDRKELMDWALRKRLVSDNGAARSPAPGACQETCSLAESMRHGKVVYDLPGKTVTEVLKAAAGHAPVPAQFADNFLDLLLEREKMCSTGIGRGVAVPHPRHPMAGLEGGCSITTCFLRYPVDFHSVDNLPVKVLFLLVCSSVSTHLGLLSRLAFCLRDDAFVSFLGKKPDPETLYKEVEKREARAELPG